MQSALENRTLIEKYLADKAVFFLRPRIHQQKRFVILLILNASEWVKKHLLLALFDRICARRPDSRKLRPKRCFCVSTNLVSDSRHGAASVGCKLATSPLKRRTLSSASDAGCWLRRTLSFSRTVPFRAARLTLIAKH